MTIKKIYDSFGIPENLREHMLRVTRVVQEIVEVWEGDIDKEFVIKAGLVHDLANIVKFKLDESSPLKSKQAEVIAKYGDDDHIATEKMLQEIGVGDNLIEIVQNKSFGNAIEVVKSNNWPLKILFYADMRVMPDGVVDLESRLTDVVTRLEKYKNRPDKEELMESARQVEKQIQKKTSADLSAIDEKLALKGWEELLNLEF